MLSIGFLSYCSKYLDQTNISNAYVYVVRERQGGSGIRC